MSSKTQGPADKKLYRNIHNLHTLMTRQCLLRILKPVFLSGILDFSEMDLLSTLGHMTPPATITECCQQCEPLPSPALVTTDTGTRRRSGAS